MQKFTSIVVGLLSALLFAAGVVNLSVYYAVVDWRNYAAIAVLFTGSAGMAYWSYRFWRMK